MKSITAFQSVLVLSIKLLLNWNNRSDGGVSAFHPVVASHTPGVSSLRQKNHHLFVQREQDIRNYTLQIRAGGGDTDISEELSAISDLKMSNSNSDIEIVKVTCCTTESEALREGVTELFKLYFNELYELGCDLGFQGFQSEWVDLPGKYDFNKSGGLFVAIDKSSLSPGESGADQNAISSKNVVGCIAIRPLEGECGEVKRMYIRESHRRKGVGNLLAEAIISHAWAIGYTEIKLDSLERLVGAVKLYEQLGFQRIPAYCECPEADHVCMNLFK